MELKERIEILTQAAEISQRAGILTLDDASAIKNIIDNLKQDKDVKNSIEVLTKLAYLTQSKGGFTLKDAYLIYIAVNDIDKVLEGLDEEKKEQEEG